MKTYTIYGKKFDICGIADDKKSVVVMQWERTPTRWVLTDDYVIGVKNAEQLFGYDGTDDEPYFTTCPICPSFR